MSDHPEPVPPHVWQWVQDTYQPEGQRLWLAAWNRGDAEKRARMIHAAQADGNSS